MDDYTNNIETQKSPIAAATQQYIALDTTTLGNKKITKSSARPHMLANAAVNAGTMAQTMA